MLRELWVNLWCPPWLITIIIIIIIIIIIDSCLDLILPMLLLRKAIIISWLSEIIQLVIIQNHRLYVYSSCLKEHWTLLDVIGFRGPKLDLIIFLKLLFDLNVTCWLIWFGYSTVVLLIDTEEVADLKVNLPSGKRVINRVQTFERQIS
jgi:hypothetical protein